MTLGEELSSGWVPEISAVRVQEADDVCPIRRIELDQGPLAAVCCTFVWNASRTPKVYIVLVIPENAG